MNATNNDESAVTPSKTADVSSTTSKQPFITPAETSLENVLSTPEQTPFTTSSPTTPSMTPSTTPLQHDPADTPIQNVLPKTPFASTPATTTPTPSTAASTTHSTMTPASPETAQNAVHSRNVLIICGGLSHERDISLSSGHRVAGMLRNAGWNVTIHDMDADLITYLQTPQTRPDVIWPLLHGRNGEDGSIRDILELTDLPYVGSRPTASRAAWNKPIAKNIVRTLGGLSTPSWVTLPESLFRELGASKVIDLITDSSTLPLFVKPTRGGSSLGCSLVTTKSELPQALVNCFAYDDVALIESAIIGTEVTVGILQIDGEDIVLPPLEIAATPGTYDYEARYTPGPLPLYIPARLNHMILERVQNAALCAHNTLHLRDFSRIDFIVDAQGVPQFLEANVTPGMTDTSLLPQAALHAGYQLQDIYSAMVTSALERHQHHEGLAL